jgi:hypothetical protein
VRTDSADSERSLVELGNELPGFIKGKGFFDWLSDCQFLKKGSAPWGLVLGTGQKRSHVPRLGSNLFML